VTCILQYYGLPDGRPQGCRPLCLLG
jgi:hypothetical protein